MPGTASSAPSRRRRSCGGNASGRGLVFGPSIDCIDPRVEAPAPVAVERIERAILLLRGHKAMLDANLAALYEVETRVLV